MSILLSKETTFIVQGITGREAVNLTRECLDYGSKGVGGVTPGRKGREVHGVPVFDTVAQAVENHGAPIDGSVVTVPPAFTKDAVFEAMKGYWEPYLRHASARGELRPGVKLDEAGYRATIGGRDLNLTAVEFQLLKVLAGRPGRIYTREQLMDAMYRDERVVADRTVDSHIKKIRRKIAAILPDTQVIEFVQPALLLGLARRLGATHNLVQLLKRF